MWAIPSSLNGLIIKVVLPLEHNAIHLTFISDIGLGNKFFGIFESGRYTKVLHRIYCTFNQNTEEEAWILEPLFI